MNQNILDFTEKTCNGCSYCSAVCPKDAIEICKDDDGFFKAHIDLNKCIKCGLCKKGCQKYSNISVNDFNADVFSVINKDEQEASRHSSAGLSEALMNKLIEEGFVVFGAEYSGGKLLHTPSFEKKDTSKYRGSKYFQSSLKEVISYIKKHTDEKIAFFGLPCQCYGIKKIFEHYHMEKNTFIVGLMCYGCPSHLLWEKYIDYIEKKFGHIDDVVFRSKYYGWHVSAFEFKTEKDIIYTKAPGDKFLDLFYSRLLFDESCEKCIIRSNLKNEDIRIGDFWGTTFSNNNDGVSCAVIGTEKGRLLFDKVNSSFIVETQDINEIIEYQSLQTNRNIDINESKKVKEILRNKGIAAAYRYYDKNINKKSFRQIVKRILYAITFKKHYKKVPR